VGQARPEGVAPAAGAAWPSWARRLFSGARAAPEVFVARLAICSAFLVVLFVGAWNAQTYPVPLGYDAQGHVNYAHVLLREHRLPTAAEASEYQQPPGYYAVAGAAALLGQKVFGWHEDKPYAQMPEVSYRGALYLNVILVLATALLLLALARLVAPDRPSVWAAALLFFAFLPVVSKTAAMFHPETLNMFLSTAALWLTTRILIRRRAGLRPAFALAAILAAGLLVRSSTLFTVITVALALGGVFLLPKLRAPHAWPRIAAALGVLVVLVGGWVGLYRSRAVPSTPDLGRAILHPLSRSSIVSSPSQFGRLSTAVFSTPFRPNYVNQALPVTYTEIWGDWIGAFAWSTYSQAPWPPALAVLKDQSWIGLLPTALAIGGWGVLLARALRRRRELVAIALMPLIAGVGYLYRSYLFLTPDGDLLKASYLLNTAPVWALGFGVAFGALGRYRLLRAGVGACLLIFAILELRFMLYGIRDHRVIF
jgi:hypothetical protein